MESFFKEILKRIPKKIRNYNRLSMGIAGRIDEILEERKISQRKFAKMMKKSESEISKWMSGKHNFTIKSIANIEAKLDTNLLYTEYDLEDIRTKLDKGKSYFTWYGNIKDDVFRDSFSSRIISEGEFELEKTINAIRDINIFSLGNHCINLRKDFVIDTSLSKEELFESIDDIVEYNSETKNLEVKP